MRRPTIAAIVLLALVTTGCGSDSEPPPDAQEQSPPSPTAPATSTSDTEVEPSDTASASAAAVAELGEPVATRAASDRGAKLELAVYPISRSGELAVLNFAVTLTEAEEGSYTLSQSFEDSNPDAGDESSYTVDGVRLSDPANGKLYLVASDGNGTCVCSNVLRSVIETGDTARLSATYAAPPEDVSSMTVTFPIFGAVTGVPVQ